jgi:hypothetical protein
MEITVRVWELIMWLVGASIGTVVGIYLGGGL